MSLFRNVRRRRPLTKQVLEGEAWAWLVEQHPILAGLESKELELLGELTTRFAHEKTFEVAEGMHLDETVRAVISIQACLPVLNLGLNWYANWKTVVVVPKTFDQEHREIDPNGVVHEWKEVDAGESWDEGPVVLSWEDVEASGWGDGFNVVIHEAAHRLDLLDGAFNGRPALHPEMDPEQWKAVFTAAYRHLEERALRRRRTVVDPYAVENPGEFFAVTTELFFEQPHALQREYPGVYAELAAFYRQDPRSRLPR
jgi:Mlc titration factor MtfA (ptsG expression regulator)